MIRYQLGCTADHVFESWFRDSAAFDEQVTRGLLECPVCGSNEVAKSIMAPAVVGASKSSTRGEATRGEPTRGEPAGTLPARAEQGATRGPMPPPPGPLLDPRQMAMRAAMRAVREKIMSEGHDVGKSFPKQARDMHDGTVPMRPIRGEATPDEARGLIEDGIMILPIPPVPEELN